VDVTRGRKKPCSGSENCRDRDSWKLLCSSLAIERLRQPGEHLNNAVVARTEFAVNLFADAT
jgi:hypothetical protein